MGIPDPPPRPSLCAEINCFRMAVAIVQLKAGYVPMCAEHAANEA